MSLFFSVREGMRGLGRAKVPATSTVLAMGLALGLVGAGGIAVQNLANVLRYIRSRFDVEVFVDMAYAEEEHTLLGNRLSEIPGVLRVTYRSREAAAAKFEEEFGEDIVTVLGENPLPASFTLRISPDYADIGDVDVITQAARALRGVEEVAYRKSLLLLINRYLRVGAATGLVAGFLLIAAAVLMAANTIRLTIFARRDLISTMRLVGATDGFVRRPFLIEGMFEGLLGALLAMGALEVALWGGMTALRGFVPVERIIVEREWYFLLAVLGIALGWLGSLISIRKYLPRPLGVSGG